jgi:hypothetical protein
MDVQLIAICALTFVIHLIGTLAYAVRIAGVRTRKIAISFSLFNILMLVSRTSNTLQGPFLAKRIEANLAARAAGHMLSDFRWLLVSATLATLVGAASIPTFQRLFSRAVLHFQAHRSIPKLAQKTASRDGFAYLRAALTQPASGNLDTLRRRPAISPTVIGLNVAAQALITVGVFSALYAGYLEPEFRVTAVTLSSIINGVATVLLFALIDPYLSIMTDDVIEGRISEGGFRRAVIWLTGSRVAGTVLAQAILVPAALLIARIARLV